jgi:hypothetical protein
MSDTTTPAGSKLKARDASLVAKIVGAVIIIAALVAGIWVKVSIDDAIKAGVVVAALFGTVDLNLLADKIFKGKA